MADLYKVLIGTESTWSPIMHNFFLKQSQDLFP